MSSLPLESQFNLPDTGRENIVKALIIRTKKYLNNLSGNQIKSNENSVILLNEKNNPLGSRITGPVYKEVKQKHSSIFSTIKHTVI